MSWRSIFAVLIVAIAASAWGGLRLGNWLVAHGPAVVTTTPELMPEAPAVPVLDANGKPVTPQAPQPLDDGGLGVPKAPTEVAWQIPPTSLDATKSNQVIAVATTPITMVEAQHIAANGGQRPLVGIGDASSLMVASRGNTPIQPIDAPSVASAATPARASSNSQNGLKAWQANLRQDLQVCSAESFFDRPSCAWAARNKYCTPNNAWGTIKDCPDKNF